MVDFVDIRKVGEQLELLNQRALELEKRYEAELALVHPSLRQGATNLVHYLALRQFDIQSLQEDLAALGLSSLRQAERDIMASIHAVQSALSRYPGSTDCGATTDRDRLIQRDERIALHKTAALGRCPDDRNTRIMVTLPTETFVSLAFSTDGRIFAAGDGRRTVRLWRAPSFDDIERAEAVGRIRVD